MREQDTAAFREQIRKLLGSRTFRQAEALRKLLSYLGEQTLAGTGGELKEYTVGVEAFGRPATYDPRVDASVRVQTCKLRQKLDEYYHTEGAQDPVIVGLPKGRFVLEFAAQPEPGPERRLRRKLRVWQAIAAGLLLLAGATVTWILLRPKTAASPGQLPPDLQSFWQPYLDGKRPALIVLGTPLFGRFGTVFFRDPEVNDERSSSDRWDAVSRALRPTAPRPAYVYTESGKPRARFN